MASATPSGLSAVSVIERDGGSTFGITTPSSVIRHMHVSDPAAAVAELDRDARGAGWVADGPLNGSTPPVAARYSRVTQGRTAWLSVIWQEADDVYVSLSSHGPG